VVDDKLCHNAPLPLNKYRLIFVRSQDAHAKVSGYSFIPTSRGEVRSIERIRFDSLNPPRLQQHNAIVSSQRFLYQVVISCQTQHGSCTVVTYFDYIMKDRVLVFYHLAKEHKIIIPIV